MLQGLTLLAHRIDLTVGHPRFFLGSDSAPHPPAKKSTAAPAQPCAAGVYTSPILLPLVAHLLESFGALDRLEAFVSTNGRAFYKKPPRDGDIIVLQKATNDIPSVWTLGEVSVIPFWAGKAIGWKIADAK